MFKASYFVCFYYIVYRTDKSNNKSESVESLTKYSCVKGPSKISTKDINAFLREASKNDKFSSFY